MEIRKMCLKGGDFNFPVAVQTAVAPAQYSDLPDQPLSDDSSLCGGNFVSVEAFPLLREDRDDQLVQIADAGNGLESFGDTCAEPICRGQVNSSNVKDYLTE